MGHGSGDILLDDLNCEGTEQSILECKFKPWTKHDCRISEWSGVTCNIEKKCSDEQWKCDNGQCITKKWLCDLENDCMDGSDEAPDKCRERDHLPSPDSACKSNEFQ